MLATAWHAVRYADVPDGGTLAVFGFGPVGQSARGSRALPLDDAPRAYELVQEKQDGAIKIVLKP